MAEMGADRTVDAIRRFASQDKIVYVHFRNVRGSFPSFDEVFHDEGDVTCTRRWPPTTNAVSMGS